MQLKNYCDTVDWLKTKTQFILLWFSLQYFDFFMRCNKKKLYLNKHEAIRSLLIVRQLLL